jgi:hypothetical protein
MNQLDYGYASITIAQRFLSHDIDKLLLVVKLNSPVLLG